MPQFALRIPRGTRHLKPQLALRTSDSALRTPNFALALRTPDFALAGEALDQAKRLIVRRIPLACSRDAHRDAHADEHENADGNPLRRHPRERRAVGKPGHENREADDENRQ
jgi:hypothetical protein